MRSPHFVPITAGLVLIDHQVGTLQLIKTSMLETAVRNGALHGQAMTAISPMLPVEWASK